MNKAGKRIPMNTLLLKQHLASSLSDLASALETNTKSESTDALVLDILKKGTGSDTALLRSISSVNAELSAITDGDHLSCEVSLQSLYGTEETGQISCQVLDGLSDVVCKAETTGSNKQHMLMPFIYQTLKGLDGVTDPASAQKAMDEIDIVSSVL